MTSPFPTGPFPTGPILAGAFAVLVLAAASPAANAQPAPEGAGPAASPAMGQGAMFRATTLSLSAYGEVKAAPDIADISLGVQAQAPTAAEAMNRNAAQMSRVIAALKRAGVADKDIQTSGLNLGAQYEYEQNKPPRLSGYQASNQVTVAVRDLARLGQTVDAAVAAGANQISGISFGLKDPRAAEDAARLKAVQALQAKAQLYAGAVGLRLERLINLSEGTGYVQPPGPIPLAAMRMAAAPPATPVEAGQLEVRVDVSGLYELSR